jgi:hypothetical protein
MDADDLRIVAAVARIGIVNRAAAELNMVQSNVHLPHSPPGGRARCSTIRQAQPWCRAK